MSKQSEAKNKNKVRFWPVLRVALAFCAIFALLLVERLGIPYGNSKNRIKVLDRGILTQADLSSLDSTCLLVYDSGNATSMVAREQYQRILYDMRITTTEQDIQQNSNIALEPYQTCVIITPDLSPFKSDIIKLTDWVEKGGRLMFGIPMQKSQGFDMIASRIGVTEAGYDYKNVEDFVTVTGFMIGGGETYHFDDAYESAMNVGLADTAVVYAKTSENVPLIWTNDFGSGRIVFCNFGYTAKAYRGIYASAYSLLEEVSAWPVINGSTYYLDDFPSPVPAGNGEYIKRDYGLATSEFYSTIWWPDVLKLGKKHNIQYTGLTIENYSDQTQGDLEKNKNTADFYYYGNMLLNQAGEIGYHGYNHQPLCLDNFEYTSGEGYNKWESSEKMHEAMAELIRFNKGLFPDAQMSVYVPPSNILSAEGRYMLGHDFPQISCVASCYLPGMDAYSQEFEIGEDGCVETPRIISSCVLDDYQRLAAFSELNFHFVNSHFMHPDDLLDPDRGAELGWAELKKRLDEYMTWLDQSAPNIRHITGSQMAGAVQRFGAVTMEKEITDNAVNIKLDHFEDEAYFLVRVNDGTIGGVTGGEIQGVTGNLYLLHATSDEITLIREGVR